jgi:hypothetical protein
MGYGADQPDGQQEAGRRQAGDQGPVERPQAKRNRIRDRDVTAAVQHPCDGQEGEAKAAGAAPKGRGERVTLELSGLVAR